MPVAVSNNACSQLEGAIDNVVTNVTIGPEGIFFPQLGAGDWFYGTISNDPVLTSQLPEIVKVTSIVINGGTGNYDLVVERGAGLDGAAPKSWSDQASFQLLVTSELLYDLVTEGVAISGATSFILNSKSVVADYTTTVADNGYFLNVSPGIADLIIDLHEIPATADEDVRIVINKRTAATDGSVVINAFAGQTINGLTSYAIDQQYSAVILHSRAGDINWDMISVPNYASLPDDGKVYGVMYGPTWTIVVEEAPEDNNYYARRNASWELTPGEAPEDGTKYVRQDAAWVPESTFVSNAGVPAGTLAAFAGSSAPEGWFFCYGQGLALSLIHISEPTRQPATSRMPSSA